MERPRITFWPCLVNGLAKWSFLRPQSLGIAWIGQDRAFLGVERMQESKFSEHHEVIGALRAGARFLDVRAEVEFAKGSLPGSVNIPILNDEERRLVGTCYKVEGQSAAIALGESLVQGANREGKLLAWLAFFQENPSSVLFCFRGGMRSQYAQQWLADAGIVVPRIRGGYKHYRQFFGSLLQSWPEQRNFIVLSGRTGCGKTEILRTIGAPHNSLDLEALAHHRGSSFGAMAAPQPSQVDFEHHLAVAMMRIPDVNTVLLEDESRLIGRCYLPESLVKRKLESPVVHVDEAIEGRALRIYGEYVAEPSLIFGPGQVLTNLLDSLAKIKNRLGGVAYGRISGTLQTAFASGDVAQAQELHHQWIQDLLAHYYDPLYDHYFATKRERIIFRGSRAQVEEFFREQL